MVYRVSKQFEVESGHMLSRHPGLCRHPHGHTRRIEVVLASPELDANGMVCDFKTLRLALRGFIERFDHALAVNSQDPRLEALRGMTERLVVFPNADPTTEAMARMIYEHLSAEVASGRTYTDEHGHAFRFPPGVVVERVRVGETSSTWAEYARE